MTAAAVVDSLGRTSEANPAARATGGALPFTVLDDLRLRIGTERPVPVMVSLLAEWPMVVSRQTDHGPMFTGPFQVESFSTGSELILSPDPP